MDRTLLPLAINLGAGEAEAIALALASPRHLLILDDGLGRRIAHLLELTYTGTMGMLVKGKQEGHLAAVKPVVEALQNRTNMYLRRDLIEWVLRAAGEG